LTVAPLLVLGTVIFMQNQKTAHVCAQQSMNLAYADLDHIAGVVYNLAKSHQEVTEKNLKHSLNVAREVVRAQEGIHLSIRKNIAAMGFAGL